MNNAIAPYNFVPMPDRVVEAESFTDDAGIKCYLPDTDRYYVDRHTGWFDVTLTTLTPIYTRAAKALTEAPDKIPETFFRRADGAYILPGSGLRGMIRSLFEIITYSSMEFVSSRHLFYRSFADSKGDIRKLYTEQFRKERLVAGLLVEKEGKLWLHVSRHTPKGFVLVRASRLNPHWAQRRRDEYPSPQPVKVVSTDDMHQMLDTKIADVVLDAESEAADGWLIVPGRDVSKRAWFQVILEPEQGNDKTDIYEVPDAVYKDYLAWGDRAHSRFRDKKGNTPRMLEANSPAFALLDPNEPGQVAVIGANMMMPLRYRNSIADVARRSIRGNVPDLDMAQAVFGRVRDGKSETSNGGQKNQNIDIVRGRVFFEDAVCTERGEATFLDAHNPTKYPDVLSGPKPTAFQIYLAQPQTYSLQHWDSAEAKLAGRKMYWHRSASAAKATLHNEKQTNVSDTQAIRPLREGLTFIGRVRFVNLTDAELGALYASLRLPRGLAHKFGMGKNLGLGSVRVEIRQTCLLDFAQRLRTLAPNAGHKPSEDVEQTLRQAYAAFVQRMFSRGTTLWGNPRMLALAALLSWDSKPDEHDTRQIPFDEQWRYRWTLPMPQRLTGIQGITDVAPVRTSASSTSPMPNITPSTNTQQDRTPAVPSPTVSAANAPSALPRPTAKRVYRMGEKVVGRVIQRDGTTGKGIVEMLNGTQVKASSLFTCIEGESYTFRITKVDNNGVAKEVVR